VRLLFLFFDCGDGFEIFGFKDLPAFQAFDVVHAVSPGDDFRTPMVASCGLHTRYEIRVF
jgi:hypothetical protein